MERAEKIVVSMAILLLLVGFLSNAFVSEKKLTEKEMDYIEINGRKISIDEIFEKCEAKEIEAKNKSYYGVPLACLIGMAEVENPEMHEYEIIASDYQKTVSWEDIEKGILTRERNAIFPHLPKAFWVKNVIKIEVIE